MTVKRMLKTGAALLLAAAALLSFSSCAKEEVVASRPSYDGTRLSEYLDPVAYEGLTVAVAEGESKSEAIWRAVLLGASVKEYPAEQVAYYREQLRLEYEYLADREGVRYEDLLALRGVTEEDLSEEARAMVKSDLVFLWILSDAGIALSDAEVSAHYDRYADRYVERYGYDRAYVDGYLREQVLESMLFDKTMEYLILHNTLQEA